MDTASTATRAPVRPRVRPGQPRDARITANKWAVFRSAVGWTSDDSGILFDDSLALHQSLAIGITDRLEITLPTILAYRIGGRGGHQLIPFGGVNRLGFGFSSADAWIFEMHLHAGATGVIRMGAAHQLLVELGVLSHGRWSESGEDDDPLDTWSGRLGLGYTITLAELVTLTAGAVAGYDVIHDGELSDLSGGRTLHFQWIVGAVYFCGRPVPLVQLHLSDMWSLDGYVTVAGGLTGPVDHRYMLGATLVW